MTKPVEKVDIRPVNLNDDRADFAQINEFERRMLLSEPLTIESLKNDPDFL